MRVGNPLIRNGLFFVWTICSAKMPIPLPPRLSQYIQIDIVSELHQELILQLYEYKFPAETS
jgi:hypothetical protein